MYLVYYATRDDRPPPRPEDATPMTTQEQTTEPKALRGFKAPCIKCGEAETVSIALHDVSTFCCNSCETEYTVDDVAELMDAWRAVLAWLDTAPVVTE